MIKIRRLNTKKPFYSYPTNTITSEPKDLNLINILKTKLCSLVLFYVEEYNFLSYNIKSMLDIQNNLDYRASIDARTRGRSFQLRNMARKMDL